MPFIDLNSVSIDFPVYGIEKQLLKKQFLRIATGGMIHSQDTTFTVKALDTICLSIHNNARIGLIGHNGAGKTTLLQLMAKIYDPTSGQAHIQGEVSSIFNVMLGIDEESTGMENILLGATLRGMSRKQAKKGASSIADFSELGDYIHMPLRTYSTGMKLRLAFAIATATSPEILLIDEVIGVGDAAFVKKARQRISEMIYSSNIVVLSSHDLDMIQTFCTHLLWLEAGKVQFYGALDEGIACYKKSQKAHL